MGEPRWVAVGARTRIRQFTRRDVDRWLLWPNHPDPLYSTYNPMRPMDGAHRDAWYAEIVQRQRQWPFAIESYDRTLIGRIFLRHVKPREGSSVLGIDLHPDYVSHGYGTDALRAFLGYYYGAAGFRRMFLSVAAYNVRARRSYEGCGFRVVGSHWASLQTNADVLRDPTYADIRELFRRGARGLEALMYDMLSEAPRDRDEAPTPERPSNF